MFNQLYTVVIGVLLVLLSLSGLAFWFKDNELNQVNKELKTSRQQTIQVKSLTEAKGSTEKFEAIKPKPQAEVKYEEVNLSIGKHSIFIK